MLTVVGCLFRRFIASKSGKYNVRHFLKRLGRELQVCLKASN